MHIIGFLLHDSSYCMLLWIEILTDGSFVKILSLLKWIYRNCIMCSIFRSKRSNLTTNFFASFAKWRITGKSCIFSLPKTTEKLRDRYPKRMSKCSETCWIHRCQWNIKSANRYSHWLIKHSFCIHIYDGSCYY